MPSNLEKLENTINAGKNCRRVAKSVIGLINYFQFFVFLPCARAFDPAKKLFREEITYEGHFKVISQMSRSLFPVKLDFGSQLGNQEKS